MKTKVVNIKNGDEFDVYIGRKGHGQTGYFGNPFNEGSRSKRIQQFKEYAIDRINTDPEYKEKIKELYGKRLGCFCHPLPCHGDVLANLAEQLKLEESVFDDS